MKSPLLIAINDVIPQGSYTRAYSTRLKDGRHRVRLHQLKDQHGMGAMVGNARMVKALVKYMKMCEYTNIHVEMKPGTVDGVYSMNVAALLNHRSYPLERSPAVITGHRRKK